MNKHVANPVNYSHFDFARQVNEAFGMRAEIFHEMFGYLFDNRIAKREGKHRAER